MDRRDSSYTDGWLLDTGAARELIARSVENLDDSADEHRDLLLADLLCAAWPTARAQDQ
jgi:hypothetical protein